MKEVFANCYRVPLFFKVVSEPSDIERKQFLMQLHNTGKRCAILSVKDGYQEPYLPKVDQGDLPCILNKYFNEESMKNGDLREIMTFKNALCIDFGWVMNDQSAQVAYNFVNPLKGRVPLGFDDFFNPFLITSD